MTIKNVTIVSTQVLQAPPPGYGGLESVTAALAKELDNLGIAVNFVAPLGSYQPKNGHIVAVGKPGQYDETFAMQSILANEASAKLLRESDVILDSSWSYSGYAMKGLGWPNPIAHVHHGVNPGWSKQPPWDKMNLIGISASHAARMQNITGRTWRHVTNGTDPELYPFQEGKGDRLLWLSRLWSYKGPVKAIEWAEAAETPIDIVGGSFGDVKEYVEYVKKRCEASKYAKFHGEVSRAAKVKFLQDAKAVLLPIQAVVATCKKCSLENDVGVKACVRCGGSDWLQPAPSWVEPQGLVAQEAALCGTPLLVTPNGGYAETTIHGKTGFFVNNAEDVCEALGRLDEVQPKYCRQHGMRYSSNVMARGYLRLFEELKNGTSW